MSSLLPSGHTEIDLEMSNFDHTIDDGLANALITENVFGRHAAWEFNGKVYWLDGKFHEDVYRYHSYMETISAPSLRELMTKVNDEWGYE